MAEFTITVDSSNGSLQVSKQSQPIPHGETSTISWTPASSDIDIRFIGFYQPTPPKLPSNVGPISTPTQVLEEPQIWQSEVDNSYGHTFPDYFFYTVYALVNGSMLCTDPEIQNQPPSGG